MFGAQEEVLSFVVLHFDYSSVGYIHISYFMLFAQQITLKNKTAKQPRSSFVDRPSTHLARSSSGGLGGKPIYLE